MQQLALISGADPAHALDALFVNAPLRDYDQRPRTNDYTLPVLGMAYIATYAQKAGFNVGVLDAARPNRTRPRSHPLRPDRSDPPVGRRAGTRRGHRHRHPYGGCGHNRRRDP
ncbi:hypothetical protein [Streptomyces sp. NPDC088246]|uniref:hypothetical protein n=1 Tax=Streptomyces sp. NPDC088246 TaxID=3365842 RepID=UPI00382221A5